MTPSYLKYYRTIIYNILFKTHGLTDLQSMAWAISYLMQVPADEYKDWLFAYCRG